MTKQAALLTQIGVQATAKTWISAFKRVQTVAAFLYLLICSAPKNHGRQPRIHSHQVSGAPYKFHILRRMLYDDKTDRPCRAQHAIQAA